MQNFFAVYGDRARFEKEYCLGSEHAQSSLPSSEYLLSSRELNGASSQVQTSPTNHSQHAAAQAALAKMHSEIVKTTTTIAGPPANSLPGTFKCLARLFDKTFFWRSIPCVETGGFNAVCCWCTFLSCEKLDGLGPIHTGSNTRCVT